MSARYCLAAASGKFERWVRQQLFTCLRVGRYLQTKLRKTGASQESMVQPGQRTAGLDRRAHAPTSATAQSPMQEIDGGGSRITDHDIMFRNQPGMAQQAEIKMGMLVDGKWQQDHFDSRRIGGKFVRADSRFRNWITPDGSPGPTGTGAFKAEPGRYHLYIGHACPWAHRTHIFNPTRVVPAGPDLKFA